MLCELFSALSSITSLANLDPFFTGVKVTSIVQLEPASRELGQLLDCSKSPGSVPAISMLLIRSGVAPGFESVTVLGALVSFSFSFPKLKLVALGLAWGLNTSARMSTVCGTPRELPTVSVAVCCL
jgi:hypothetical protein